MANGDIQITLRVTDDGTVQVINQVNDSLNNLNRSAQNASDGGVKSLFSGASDLYYGFKTLSSSFNEGIGLIQQFNDLGTAAIRADMGLSTLSRGQSAQYLDAMNNATGDLIDNLSLSQDAMLALSTGIVKSSDDMAHLAHDGAVLGLVFKGGAQSGVQAFEQALEHVGQTRPLAQLGLDINAVKQEYALLTSEGVDKAAAWQKALYDVADPLTNKLEPALTSTGTAAEKLSKQIQDITAHAGENVAIGVEATLTLIGAGWDVILNNRPGHEPLPSSSPTTQIQIVPQASFTPNTNTPSYQLFQNALSGTSGSAYGMNSGYYEDIYGNNQFKGNYTPENGARGVFNDTSGTVGNFSAPNAMGPVVDPAAISAAKANLQALFNDANAAAAPFLSTVKQVRDLISAPVNSTFAQAFGTHSNEITSTYGNDMQGDIASARNNLAQRDRAKGMSQTQIDKDLAQFDANSQMAMDQYDLATGQATQKSIEFRNTQADLAKALSEGKISVAAYAQEMQNLAMAAQNADTKVGSLTWIDAQAKSATTGVHLTGADWESVGEHSKGTAQAGTGKDDPFAPVKKSADDAMTSVNKVRPTVDTVLGQLDSYSKTTHDPLAGVTTSAKNAVSHVNDVASALQGLPAMVAADIQIHIQATTSTGGSGGAGSHGKVKATA